MTERELPQINPEIKQTGVLLEGNSLPNWTLAPPEQGEDPDKDDYGNDQLSCVFTENEDGGGEGSWSIIPERGVEFDHVAAGWAVHDSGCENINGGVIGDRFWQAVNLGYEFPGTKEVVVVTDLNGKDTCEISAEDFWEAAQGGLKVIEDGAAAVEEQPQEEAEEVLLESEAVVEEVTEADKAEMRIQIVRTFEDGVLDTIFSPKIVWSCFGMYGIIFGATVLGFTFNYLRKRFGSSSGGGGRPEPLVKGKDRRRSKDKRAKLYDFFWDD